MHTLGLCASLHGQSPQDLCPSLIAKGLITPCTCAGTIAFVGILGYIISFSLGAGAVTGLMVPEVNPERLRGELAPFAGAIVALLAVVAPQSGCTCLFVC